MILVPRKWGPGEVQKAELKATEFKPNRYTSGSANLDNMVALNKAVILCEVHTRKFSPKKARYRAHPDKRMRRVNGCCDVCKQFELCFLFLNEKDALEEQRKLEKYTRTLEYSHFYRG